MHQLDLSSEQREVLLETLNSALADLRFEIGDTDSYDFREGLKARKTIFEQIVAALESAD